MAVFVVVHKPLDPEGSALRTTRIEAVDGDHAVKEVQDKFPHHQILQVEKAKDEIIFEEEPPKTLELAEDAMRTAYLDEQPVNPETIEQLVKQFSQAPHNLKEIVARSFNAGYESHMADQQPQEGPQAPSRHDQEIEDLRTELDRRDDKLYLMERLIEAQPPFGTDLANFRRRLLLLVRA